MESNHILKISAKRAQFSWRIPSFNLTETNFVKKWFKEEKYEIGFILREFFPGTTMVNDTKACLKSILLTVHIKGLMSKNMMAFKPIKNLYSLGNSLYIHDILLKWNVFWNNVTFLQNGYLLIVGQSPLRRVVHYWK